MNRRTRVTARALAGAAALSLAGCGGDSGPSGGSAATHASGSSAPAASATVTGTITVLAAASLKESFTQFEKAFERRYPGTDVVLSFGPSSGLARQIIQGAPADVFASASTKNMDQVVSAGEATGPAIFARNTLTIVTPPGNPAKVSGLNDLGDRRVKVALCQRQVPCGGVAATVLGRAKVTVTPVTEEEDVKAVLSKVTLGEVDAGLVYVTDAKAAGPKVRQVAIPTALNASTDYPIASLKGGRNPTAAAAFVALVRSPAGRAILGAAGFAAAP